MTEAEQFNISYSSAFVSEVSHLFLSWDMNTVAIAAHYTKTWGRPVHEAMIYNALSQRSRREQ